MPRPGLAGALEAGRSGRLTVISAPTGFGKSSALAEWAAQTPARVAWYALDAGDNDPFRFWSYVVASIGDAAPEVPRTAARRLRAPGVSLADEVLPVIVNELASVTAPLVIVLDDYHEVGEPEIHAGMDYLLERLAPDVHVVISTQTDPPLRLGRLRARGELSELDAQRLRFSDAEAAELLNGRHALQLTPDELTGVQSRAEGWVAGLHLVGLTLRDRPDRAQVIARMPIDDRTQDPCGLPAAGDCAQRRRPVDRTARRGQAVARLRRGGRPRHARRAPPGRAARDHRAPAGDAAAGGR